MDNLQIPKLNTKFPNYFWEKDTALVLSRLLAELDNEMVDYYYAIPNLLWQYDSWEIDGDFLNYLAEMLGNPPSLPYGQEYGGNNFPYRTLLKFIPIVYKYRGTDLGYVMMFKLIGLDVWTEDLGIPIYRYDDEYLYDEGLRYDGNCPACSYYNLHIRESIDGDSPNWPTIAGEKSPQELLDILSPFIKFVEPINAVLSKIIYGDNTEEPIENNWILTTGIWANQWRWDDSKYWRDEPLAP
jgi:hypothetical protein